MPLHGVGSYKEWIEALSEEQRQYEIYRLLLSMDERMCKLERRPIWDKTLAFAGGIVGGIIAIAGYFKFTGGH